MRIILVAFLRHLIEIRITISFPPGSCCHYCSGSFASGMLTFLIHPLYHDHWMKSLLGSKEMEQFHFYHSFPVEVIRRQLNHHKCHLPPLISWLHLKKKNTENRFDWRSLGKVTTKSKPAFTITPFLIVFKYFFSSHVCVCEMFQCYALLSFFKVEVCLWEVSLRLRTFLFIWTRDFASSCH